MIETTTYLDGKKHDFLCICAGSYAEGRFFFKRLFIL